MTRQLLLLDIPFYWFALIDPERVTRYGAPIELMPQDRYAKAATTRLNTHGNGPFCKFAVPGLPTVPGLYAISVDGKLKYVGKGVNLAERWGSRGYGTISPKNCYIGGQSTNCKINHRVFLAAKENRSIDLWIHQMDEPGGLESRLIRSLNPPWNSQVPWS